MIFSLRSTELVLFVAELLLESHDHVFAFFKVWFKREKVIVVKIFGIEDFDDTVQQFVLFKYFIYIVGRNAPVDLLFDIVKASLEEVSCRCASIGCIGLSQFVAENDANYTPSELQA